MSKKKTAWYKTWSGWCRVIDGFCFLLNTYVVLFLPKEHWWFLMNICWAGWFGGQTADHLGLTTCLRNLRERLLNRKRIRAHLERMK